MATQVKEKEIMGMALPGPTRRVDCIKERFLAYKPEICVERAKLVTESYKETKAEPIHIRRAKALEKIFSEMTIFIQEDELIVGNQATKPRSSPIFPEFSNKWREAELDRLEKRTGDVFLIAEDKKKTLRELFPYWEGKTSNERAATLMTQDAKDAQAAGVFTVGNYFFNGVGHISVDYAKVLAKGLEGIIAEADKEMAGLDVTDPEPPPRGDDAPFALSFEEFYRREHVYAASVLRSGRNTFLPALQPHLGARLLGNARGRGHPPPGLDQLAQHHVSHPEARRRQVHPAQRLE